MANLIIMELQGQANANHCHRDIDKNNDKAVEESQAKERTELQQLVAEREEICRKLKLVKMYRSKNDLDALQRLIDKWRDACQAAILRLYERRPEPKPSLAEFISTCRLDKGLIRFDDEEEAFT